MKIPGAKSTLKLVHLGRPLVQHMAGILHQRLAKAAVGNEKDTDHARDSNPERPAIDGVTTT